MSQQAVVIIVIFLVYGVGSKLIVSYYLNKYIDFIGLLAQSQHLPNPDELVSGLRGVRTNMGLSVLGIICNWVPKELKQNPDLHILRQRILIIYFFVLLVGIFVIWSAVRLAPELVSTIPHRY
jgi:hypothetical protein